MKPLPSICAVWLVAMTLRAQPTNPLPLWPEGAPGALGTNDQDIPTLTAFVPDPAKATGAAMVICPGGGYTHLAPHEGKNYALWLAEQGVTGFVLKYRLGTDGYRHPCMLPSTPHARCAWSGRAPRNGSSIRIASGSWVHRREAISPRRCSRISTPANRTRRTRSRGKARGPTWGFALLRGNHDG